MITTKEFNELLECHGTLIIDGALATELETRGHNLNHPLWSAKILREDPDAVEKVHLDYYLAGADIAITASYQASLQGLHDHFGLSNQDAMTIIGTSARLAQQAREKACKHVGSHRKLLVAGSVGPYGACLADGSEYRGDYQRTASEFQEFHRPRIQALIDAGVDLLAIETMPQLTEIDAVLQLLEKEYRSAICWISCTLRDSEHLSDGRSIQDFIKLIQRYQRQVVAVGVNCVATAIVTDALNTLKSCTQLPLLCYPNSGETWNAETKTWSGSGLQETDNMKQIRSWRDSGALLIGGCCRTGPKYIDLVRKALSGQNLQEYRMSRQQ
jgi:homocysteine S-methyltransferase